MRVISCTTHILEFLFRMKVTLFSVTIIQDCKVCIRYVSSCSAAFRFCNSACSSKNAFQRCSFAYDYRIHAMLTMLAILLANHIVMPKPLNPIDHCRTANHSILIEYPISVARVTKADIQHSRM